MRRILRCDVRLLFAGMPFCSLHLEKKCSFFSKCACFLRKDSILFLLSERKCDDLSFHHFLFIMAFFRLLFINCICSLPSKETVLLIFKAKGEWREVVWYFNVHGFIVFRAFYSSGRARAWEHACAFTMRCRLRISTWRQEIWYLSFQHECWENFIGAAFYKLIVIDFLTIIFYSFTELIRK